MKKSADKRALAPVDMGQRYTIAEAVSYLRIWHVSIYKEINARRIRVIKHGKRTFAPGSEIARLSRLEGTQDATRETPAKPEPSLATSYRLLDSRIHQALIRDIARQQALWDVIQKFEGKLQHLVTLVEKLGQQASRREIRVAESSTPLRAVQHRRGALEAAAGVDRVQAAGSLWRRLPGRGRDRRFEAGSVLEPFPLSPQGGEAHLHLEGQRNLDPRQPQARREQRDYCCFPAGQRAGHHLFNHTKEKCLFMTIGDNHPDDIACFPNTGKARIRATGKTVPITDVLRAK
jgi:hypothetical protein